MRREVNVLLGALILLTACGKGSAGRFAPSGQAQGTPGSTASAPAQSPAATSGSNASAAVSADVPGSQQSVLAGYRRFQQVYEESLNDTGQLYAVATEPMLSDLVQQYRETAAKGVFWRFHNALNPRVTKMSPNGKVAHVNDCIHTLAAYKFDAKTGKMLASYKGGFAFYNALMQFVDGTWKLSDARSKDVKRC